MKRVIVIGSPGSGKSTLSRALQKKTGLPLYYLDMLYWNADKTVVEKSVFRARVAQLLEEDAWIIDGNYGSSLEPRLAACDTVILLDYPLDVCLAGVRARRGKPREDMPWIETEEDAEFIAYIKGFRTQQLPEILALLEKYRDKNVMTFTSRAQADAFVEGL